MRGTPDQSATGDSRRILTPSGLNRIARDLLEGEFPAVWVEGELSNVARPASGHLYFVLKDDRAQVRCAMFKPRSTQLRFRPAEGTKVLARGRISLYEARGEYQLIVEHLEEAGEGALRRAFEELKARLAAEGLFDAAAKRPLPRLPHRIGVITSATGAAIRDVLSVLGRRFPLVEVDILAVPVQGVEAPPTIVAALAAAGNARRHDVLLLTRGGGSLEDLMAFNDERVARAIRASPIPVVSAIGHEVDFTIADFAADERAPTPSAAAEMLVPDAVSVLANLDRDAERLRRLVRDRVAALAQRTDHALGRLTAQRPDTRLAQARQRLALLRRMLAQPPRILIERLRLRMTHDDSRMREALPRGLERGRTRLEAAGRTLHAVSPLATLERGYSILLAVPSGTVVRSVRAVSAGDRVDARLADGTLGLRVDETLANTTGKEQDGH